MICNPLMKAMAIILVTVIYQGHLTLKIINIVLQALPGFYFGCEEVVVVPLKFSLRSKRL